MKHEHSIIPLIIHWNILCNQSEANTRPRRRFLDDENFEISPRRFTHVKLGEKYFNSYQFVHGVLNVPSCSLRYRFGYVSRTIQFPTDVQNIFLSHIRRDIVYYRLSGRSRLQEFDIRFGSWQTATAGAWQYLAPIKIIDARGRMRFARDIYQPSVPRSDLRRY